MFGAKILIIEVDSYEFSCYRFSSNREHDLFYIMFDVFGGVVLSIAYFDTTASKGSDNHPE